MDDFDLFSAQPSAQPSAKQENDLFGSENTGEKTNNQNDDASWIIENNPNTTTSYQPDVLGEDNSTSTGLIQSDDVLKSTTPSTFDDNIFDNTTPAATDNFQDNTTTLNDNFMDDITSSQAPTATNNNLLDNRTTSQTPITFDNNDEFNISSSTNEDMFSNNSTNEQDKYSTNMFSTEVTPLQAITKKREEEIAAKDAEEKRKIDELKQQAKSDLERWYTDRKRQMEQKRQTMQSDENDLRTKALEKSTKEQCDWSKVVRLLEFTDGTQLSKSKRDVTRMKSCMLTAKRMNDTQKLANGV
ncbi:unnamed protein product [Adineta steineri]|uniref:Clathrin light chain n=1 Tax=Adineta steineri TaxID=433720 RepID=A0A813YYK4_9BILA|nr:unnamed protein product [Adineta steineri]CAF1472936.1 unnamed protein product [Adineta steineri]